jgi:hypothetical protein
LIVLSVFVIRHFLTVGPARVVGQFLYGLVRIDWPPSAPM